MSLTRTLLALALLAGLQATAPAQQTASSGLVLANVVGADGQILIDLQPDDFLVEEDGVEREVLAVRVADYPVVVLVDDRSGVGNDLPAVREAATRFIERLGDRAVALGTLANPPTIVSTFQDPRALTLDRLGRLPPNPSTLLRPLESIAAGAALIRDVSAPFSAIVVVTERPVNPVDPESLRLLNPVLDSRATVHVVARQPGGITPGSGNGSRMDTDVLSDLAQQTGGQYTPVYAVASYAAALERLAERMVAELLVEYLVPPKATAARVRVGVRVPGARVTRLKVSR